jgi:hypothetical protein
MRIIRAQINWPRTEYSSRILLKDFFNNIGHEDAFPPHRPNAGNVIGKETVAWARGSGRDAPIADARPSAYNSYHAQELKRAR